MKKFIKLLTAAALSALIAVTAAALTACNQEDETTIRISASPTPHAEILKTVVKDVLAEQGYTLEVIEYNDYVIPNTATESGDLDANYFQHNLYLDDFNATRGTHLKAVAQVHYEPFGIYRGSYKNGSLADIPQGSTVLIPNDGTNEARALFLLQKEGLITLKEGITASNATKLDVVNNPKNLNITELEAAQIPLSLQDGAIGVINGNYALGAGLKLADAVASEDKTDENVKQYVNVVAVKEGNENKPKIKALVAAILSDEVKEYINATYNGAVVPVF
ncbi:MAG: MetQ/NlpA family ABC transporter substrate-binding protein [Clostridia bacterium]|nr:MetQ/NlpA family ABC transporter substrate-binding protein [Clostridia bacterium]